MKFKIAKDKLGHLRAGALVALVVGIFFGSDVGMLAAFAAGATKELYDYIDNVVQARKGNKPKHSVEFLDFWFTVFGGLAILAVGVLL